MHLVESEVIKAFEDEKTMVLATCEENRVTARLVSHVNAGLTLYFQTGADSLKLKQLRANPNGAACVGTYQVEGAVRVLGHPLDKGNEFFAEAYKAKHPNSFNFYTALSDEVLIEFIPTSVRQWRYDCGEPQAVELKL